MSCTILNKVSNNNRIVVIVDDLELTFLFRAALKDISRVKIFTFTDPVLALEHFQINEYAYVLVISDFKMPGLNGMEFLKKIKALNPFVRTILMTTFEVEDKIFRVIPRIRLLMHSFKSQLECMI